MMVFISYSWDSDEHVEKVSRLVKFLKKCGIQVVWDRELDLGKRIPFFMEDSLQKCSQVLFICTPRYKEKADGRDGGVGYETNVITGELYQSHNEVKYIPVLFEGDWDRSMPIWASGKLGVDLREESMREYDKLLDSLKGQEDTPAILEKEDSPEMEQPVEEPVSREERRALEQIYQEVLEFKTWLVGLKTRAGGGMEDTSGSEEEMWRKAKGIQRMKDTYDFVLKGNVTDRLNSFLYNCRVFEHRYTHFEEDAEEEAAKEAKKKRGFLSMLFSVSVGERLRISHEDLKEACNAVLSAIVQRLG